MCDWRLSHLRKLILVTYASSQWRGNKFLIEHVVNVKTLNGSEHAVGQPAWQESSKVKSQSRDFRFIFDEKWRSTLRLKYVGLQ